MIPAALGLISSLGTLALAQTIEPEDENHLPIKEITRKQWLAFCKTAMTGNPKMISPSFRLGAFGFHVRRLCDLGVMRDPIVTHCQGRQVWDATWVPPHSLAQFQSDPIFQYQLFARSMTLYDGLPCIQRAIGREVDGVTITRSGALMLAHRAGPRGMHSWIECPKIRQRFYNNTTKFFEKANGIF